MRILEIKHFFLLLAFLIWQLPAQAQAPALRIEKSFFHDPQDSLPLDQLSQRDFTAFDGDLNLGYITGAVWVRIQIIAPEISASINEGAAQQALTLRVGPHALEHLELLEPAGQGWVVQRAGARWPNKTGPCIDDLHCFVLRTPARTVYLKVVTPTLLKANFAVLSGNDITQQVAIRTGQLISAYSLSLIMLAVGLLFYLFDRSKILLTYFWLQLLIIFSLISTTGSLAQWAQWISPDRWTDLSYLFVIGRSIGLVFISRAALAKYGPSKTYSRGCWIIAILLLFTYLLLIPGQITLALKINLAFTLLNPAFQIYGIFSARSIPPRFLKIFISSYCCYALIAALAATNIFLASSNFPNINFLPNLSDGTYSGIVIGLLVFWLALAENSRQRTIRVEEAQALRVQVAGAQAHEAALKERGALIDMLAHELKNPLSTMKFALASLRGQLPSADRIRHMEHSIHRMDQMIEMVSLSNRIEQTQPAASRENIDAEDFVTLLAEGFSTPERFVLQMDSGVQFHADRQLLSIAIENLMSNAYKYSNPEPIHIEVRRDTGADLDQVRFKISNAVDPGCEPDEARLFERYYRHPSTSDRPGMGIGLSLVRAAAEKMNAQVHYRFEASRVCFEVTLPC